MQARSVGECGSEGSGTGGGGEGGGSEGEDESAGFAVDIGSVSGSVPGLVTTPEVEGGSLGPAIAGSAGSGGIAGSGGGRGEVPVV